MVDLWIGSVHRLVLPLSQLDALFAKTMLSVRHALFETLDELVKLALLPHYSRLPINYLATFLVHLSEAQLLRVLPNLVHELGLVLQYPGLVVIEPLFFISVQLSLYLRDSILHFE